MDSDQLSEYELIMSFIEFKKQKRFGMYENKEMILLV